MATPTTKLELISFSRKGNGVQQIFKHWSKSTNCEMKFSIFIPDSTKPSEKFHAIFFLAGAFCNEQDFLNASNFHHHTTEYPFVIVSPDTGPKVDLPGDKNYAWLGQTASWFMDSVKEPWCKHYQMYSYVSKELPELVLEHFPVHPKFGICGFSMGGVAAIVIGLRNPDRFPSISGCSLNCYPTNRPFIADGVFAPLLGYENKSTLWILFDTFEVVQRYDGPLRKILVHMGAEDKYLPDLQPERLLEAAENNSNVEVTLRYQEGAGHSVEVFKKAWGSHFQHHFQQLIDNSS